VKRIVAASLLIVLAIAEPAAAQGRRETLVVVMDGASLPDLLATPQFDALATVGGVALMNGRTGVRRSLLDAFEPKHDPAPGELGVWPIVYRDIGSRSPSAAAVEVTTMLESLFDDDDPTLLVVISATPSAATAEDGDELGTVVVGWGQAGALLQRPGGPHALTSDSTRRAGVVADVDPAATVAEWLDLPYDAGAPIERTDEPAPLELYERYLQQRRLAVPAAAASWGLMMLFGLAAVVALALRGRLSPRALSVIETLTLSLPWLAIGLLLVGHLPSLTPATVTPFSVASVTAGVTFTGWVASRRGIFVALAATGGVILAILAVEAAFGWPAAVTPLAGGGQLDGGRFFGMPNVEIGIVLGSALFVAHRIRVGRGFLLLVVCGLAAGSPWTGANVGAAITLFAAAGLWLAMRRRWPWWIVGLTTGAVTAAGMAVIAIMHRSLTDRPTHVTAFLENTSSFAGVIDRLTGRLEIGWNQLTDTPLAAIPVVGVLVLLVVVLRPPAPIAASFEGHDAWHDALLVLLLGSIVAYLANDTGAAALGFGFGFALSGLLGVSLAVARGKMRR
jgi:hypothetical protein